MSIPHWIQVGDVFRSKNHKTETYIKYLRPSGDRLVTKSVANGSEPYSGMITYDYLVENYRPMLDGELMTWQQFETARAEIVANTAPTNERLAQMLTYQQRQIDTLFQLLADNNITDRR